MTYSSLEINITSSSDKYFLSIFPFRVNGISFNFITADGIICLGKILLRGFRIELGEIEQKLLSISNFKEGCVIVKNDEVLGKMLVAYVSIFGCYLLAYQLECFLAYLVSLYKL
jgi:hypothetical protein